MENGTCWFIENTKCVWLIGFLPCSVWWCDFIETKLIIEKLDCKKQTKYNRMGSCLSASIVQYRPWTLNQNLAWECLSQSNDIVVPGGKFWVDAWTNYMLITLFYKGNILLHLIAKWITKNIFSKQSKNLWKGFNMQVLISRSFYTNLSKERCHSALECVWEREGDCCPYCVLFDGPLSWREAKWGHTCQKRCPQSAMKTASVFLLLSCQRWNETV